MKHSKCHGPLNASTQFDRITSSQAFVPRPPSAYPPPPSPHPHSTDEWMNANSRSRKEKNVWVFWSWFKRTGVAVPHYSAVRILFGTQFRAIRFPQTGSFLSGNTSPGKWRDFISATAWGGKLHQTTPENHIGVWDDKWRPWITALLLLYLEMWKNNNFSALKCFSFLQIARLAADNAFWYSSYPI